MSYETAPERKDRIARAEARRIVHHAIKGNYIHDYLGQGEE